MPKREIDWDNPWMKEKEVMKLGAHLGVSQDDFWEEDMGSAGDFDRDGYAKEVERAYSNNYDVRRTMEAARMAGRDDVPNNIGNMEDAYDIHKFMKRTHHNKIGNEEDFDYDEMAGVTNYWVKQDRNNLKEEMEKTFEDYMEEADTDDGADPVDQQADQIEFSPELQAAQSRVNENERNMLNSSNSIYGFNAADAIGNATVGVRDAQPDGDGQDQRLRTSNEFLKNFKVDLMSGLRENPYGTTTTQAPDY